MTALVTISTVVVAASARAVTAASGATATRAPTSTARKVRERTCIAASLGRMGGVPMEDAHPASIIRGDPLCRALQLELHEHEPVAHLVVELVVRVDRCETEPAIEADRLGLAEACVQPHPGVTE